MSPRSNALFVAICFTIAPSWPLEIVNNHYYNSGIVLKIRSPLPGQKWLPSEAVQVHVNVDVMEGPAADAVRSEVYAYETCYHGGGPEPPQCKPLVEGNAKSAQVHYTEDGGDKSSETPNIWAVAASNGLATVTAWLQRIESEQLPHPRAALAPPATVHLWENASAAAIEFERWLNVPHAGYGTVESDYDSASEVVEMKVQPLTPILDPSARAAIFNHLGFALLDKHRYAESAHAFHCVEAIQRISSSDATINVGSELRVQGSIPHECSPGYSTAPNHSPAKNPDTKALMNAGCHSHGASISFDECRAATILRYALCVGESSAEAAVALGLDDVLSVLCPAPDQESDAVSNESAGWSTEMAGFDELDSWAPSPQKKIQKKAKVQTIKPLLLVMVGNGLSNRLRAVASAVLLARRSHRRLVLLWPLEAHCRARFSDLFNVTALSSSIKGSKRRDDSYACNNSDSSCRDDCLGCDKKNVSHEFSNANFEDEFYDDDLDDGDDDATPLVMQFVLDCPPDVVDDFFESLVIAGSKPVKTHVYSFWFSPTMDLKSLTHTLDAREDISSSETLTVGPRRAHHAYARSSYWLVSKHHGDTRLGGGSDSPMRAVLKHIFAAPSTVVQATLTREQGRVASALNTTSMLPSQPPLPRVLVAVHIRMQANMSKDVPSPPAHMATEMEMLGDSARSTREACAPPSFMVAMRKLQSSYRAKGYQTVFYIASDVPEAVAALQAAFAPGIVLGYDGHLCRTRSEGEKSNNTRRQSRTSSNDGDGGSGSSGNEEDMTRSSACLQRALVEQIMLTDERVVTRVISHWSTFSEIVTRVAPLSAVPAVSGCSYRLGDVLAQPKRPQLSDLPLEDSSSETSDGIESDGNGGESVPLTASESLAAECAAGNCVVAYALPVCEEEWLKEKASRDSSGDNEKTTKSSSESVRSGATSNEMWPGEFAASFAGARALSQRLRKVATNSTGSEDGSGRGKGRSNDGFGRFGSQYPFAHWRMRIYHACSEDANIPNGLLKELATAGVELVNVSPLDSPHTPPVHSNDGENEDTTDNHDDINDDHDEGIDRFVARGLHSGLLSRRDEASVSAWALSGLACHAVRDHPHHFGIESAFHTRESWRGHRQSPPSHHRWAVARGAQQGLHGSNNLTSAAAAMAAAGSSITTSS